MSPETNVDLNDELGDGLGRLLRSRVEPRPSTDRTRAIGDECTRGLTPSVALKASQRIAISAALCAAVALSLLVMQGANLNSVGETALYGLLAWTLIEVGLLILALSKPGQLSPKIKTALLAVVPSAFFLFLASTSESMPFAEFIRDGVATSATFQCEVAALISGLFAAGGVMFVWRRTDPFNPGFSGSIAGMVGGIAGALAVGLVCPHHSSWHLWLGHGLSVIALIIAGRLLGRRIFAP